MLSEVLRISVYKQIDKSEVWEWFRPDYHFTRVKISKLGLAKKSLTFHGLW